MPSTLSTLAEMLARFSDRTPHLNEESCLNYLHNHAGKCTACADICPVNAVTLAPWPQFDTNGCLACDACAAVCPASALSGQRSPLDVWREAFQQVQHEPTVRLVCRAAGPGQYDAVRISCASSLSVEFYIGLALEGVGEVLIYTADCETCPLQESLVQAQRAIAAAREFLGRLDMDLSVMQEIGRPPLVQAEAASSAVSRRQFLSTLWKPGASHATSASSVDKLAATGVGWRRALLLDALLRHISADSAIEMPGQPGLWAIYSVSDQCVGCQMCAEFCPTHALVASVGEDQSEVTLWFSAARCVACGLCERVCFKHAVSMDETIPLSALMSGEYAPVWHGQSPANPLKARMKSIRSA